MPEYASLYVCWEALCVRVQERMGTPKWGGIPGSVQCTPKHVFQGVCGLLGMCVSRSTYPGMHSSRLTTNEAGASFPEGGPESPVSLLKHSTQ